MKRTAIALAALFAFAALAADFFDVPKGEAVTLPNGGRLVEIQYFGGAGTCGLSGVRTLSTNAVQILVDYATNTTVTATATTNTVSVLAFCSTNAVTPTVSASAGVPTAASTNLYLPPGLRIIRTGNADGRATAVLE